jgi:hypothetical protein
MYNLNDMNLTKKYTSVFHGEEADCLAMVSLLWAYSTEQRGPGMGILRENGLRATTISSPIWCPLDRTECYSAKYRSAKFSLM